MRSFHLFTSFLLLLSFLSFSSEVSLDLKELRNKVSRVTPRGYLWATGHFMGKKSEMDAALMPDAPDALSSRQGALEGLLLDLLRVVLGSQEKGYKSQELDVLRNILKVYDRVRE